MAHHSICDHFSLICTQWMVQAYAVAGYATKTKYLRGVVKVKDVNRKARNLKSNLRAIICLLCFKTMQIPNLNYAATLYIK